MYIYIYIIVIFFYLYEILHLLVFNSATISIQNHKAIIWPIYVTSRSCVDLPRFIWSPLTLLPVWWLLPFIQICCQISMFTCSLHFYYFIPLFSFNLLYFSFSHDVSFVCIFLLSYGLLVSKLYYYKILGCWPVVCCP